ncbi:hypothetical protein X777_04274 [Ooceraea biroi]|uniref:Uncharacterized protein n=1 Tax=Ooceraea biroi TaxID=2015173 RepID=A0A026WHH3_OOCBI|nr:hypothetical protein X777_04274 [Ooceraea biroi]
MSPASQGALEVERYIGSCLISSNVRAGLHAGKPVPVCRKQQQQQQQQQEQSATLRGSKARGCYNAGQGCYPGLADQQQHQCQVQYGGPGGWTGAPLISMTSSPRRLAIHTQGAPLILAGRFYNRGKIHGNNSGSGSPNGAASTLNGNVVGNYVHNSGNSSMTSNGATRCPASRIATQKSAEAALKKPPTMTTPNSKTTANPDCSSAAVGKENAGSSSIANIDSLSIASDESSGSNNSENSLPRIIKPRKRRKKDRKPPNNVVAGGVDAVKPADESQTQRQLISGCLNAAGEQSTGIVGVKPYAPSCYEPRVYEATGPHLRNYRRPPIGHRENIYGGCRAPSSMHTAELADVRQQRYAAHHRHHVQVKVLDDNRNVVAAPMRAAALPKGYRHHANGGNGNCTGNLPRRYVHHEYGESVCEAAARGDGPGPCQCRYCDPAGLIWDVDRNGYSPFLTAPPPPPSSTGVEYCRGHFNGQIPLFLTPPSGLQEQCALDRLFDEHPRSHDDGRDTGSAVGPGGVVLRRSWSDPTSYFSYADEIAAPTRDVGVIGDRGGSEGGKYKRTLWRGDSIGNASANSATSNVNPAGLNGPGGGVASPKGLEVSTEIITSPNGHRDLEIKFYSSPSPAERLAEEDKSSSLAEEADDDDNNGDDDFSDIWSYHESKLQQDFRTLLQAEE